MSHIICELFQIGGGALQLPGSAQAEPRCLRFTTTDPRIRTPHHQIRVGSSQSISLGNKS